MTLIVSAINERCAIQISDRRLTCDGKLVTDESNKAIALTTPDARLAVGFTGLATAGSFKTRDWLMEAITAAATIDAGAHGIITRLANLATEKWKQTMVIRTLPADSRRLDIVFTGYSYRAAPPLAFHSIISNHQEDGGIGDFQESGYVEHRPHPRPPTFVKSAGFDPATVGADLEVMKAVLQKQVPPARLLQAIHSRMVKIADRPGSKGMIGKQFDTIIIERDGDVLLGYESAIVKSELASPATIQIFGPGQVMMTKDAYFRVPDSQAPMIVPRVHRNAECPCGSGKRYKECHRLN